MARTSTFSYLAGPQAIWGPYGPPFQLDRRGAGLKEIFQVLSVRLSVHLSIFLSIPPSLFGLVVSYTANIPQTSDLAYLGYTWQQTVYSLQYTVDNRQQTVDSRQQTVGSRQQTVYSRQQTSDIRQQRVDSTHKKAGSSKATHCLCWHFCEVKSHVHYVRANWPSPGSFRVKDFLGAF